MSYIIDAGLVFILRELMIGLFEQKLSSEMIYALSLLLLVLGALRVASVLLYQRERSLNDPDHSSTRD